LRRIPYFRGVDGPMLTALWPHLRERTLKRGEVLLRAGDSADAMFLISSGSVLVSRPISRRVEEVLNRLGAGEVFGEMSVFGAEQTHSVTVQGEGDTVLLSLNRDALNRFIEANPRSAAKLLLVMIRVCLKRFSAAKGPLGYDRDPGDGG